MKKDQIQLIINGVLGVAVVVLFVLHFVPNKKQAASAPAAAKTVPAGVNTEIPAGNLPLAYINLDSLMVKYQFAIDANNKLNDQAEKSRVQINQQGAALQKEYTGFQQEVLDFQKKVQNNAFLSQDRYESEANRLQKKEEQLQKKSYELQQLEDQLSAELMQENQKLMVELVEKLDAFMEEYNADGRYHMIFVNTGRDNIMMSTDGYDITNEVVAILNERYQK